MFAGTLTKAKELIDRYSRHLNDPATNRTPQNALDLLTIPLEEQQHADAAAYLSATYGMAYGDFLKLDSQAQQSLTAGLTYWKHSCELIIVWLGVNFVRLFRVSDRVQEERCFSAIGSGANVAQACLYGRSYATLHDLREAIYYVYEAKRASDRVPGVGADTHLAILEFDQDAGKNVFYPLFEQELDRLSKQYEQLGKPRAFGDLKADDVLDLRFIPRM
jgi:hypothetical protein